MKRTFRSISALVLTIVILTLASARLPADTGTCAGAMTTLPFTDVAGNAFFCQTAEAFFSGLTNGTTATTYSPSDTVPRGKWRHLSPGRRTLRRGHRRAALDQWETPAAVPITGKTTVGALPHLVKSDGADLLVANNSSGTVTRVRGS
jgi:hypothetical protein